MKLLGRPTGLAQKAWRGPELWQFLATMLRLGVGVFFVPLLTRTLAREELGLWYVFLSMSGLFSLLDFGFSGNITRAVAYLWGGSERLQCFGVAPLSQTGQGLSPNYRLLGQLIGTIRRYYFWMGTAVTAIAIVGGGWWVGKKTTGLANPEFWQLAWAIYALGLLIGFWGGLWGAILMGINRVRQAQQIGILGQILFYLVAVTGLLSHWGVWALVIAGLVSGITSRALQARAFWRAVNTHLVPTADLDWDLLRTLWPNCWRLGVVATGAFLILQANTLICSAYLGLAETAAYGLSLQLVSMMVGVSSIWITTQQPLVAQMRAQHDLDGIARLYGRRMRWFVLSVLFGGGLICCLAPYFLRIIGARTPLLPWPVLLLLIVILALEAHHGHYAMLVMSENRNPFVLPAIISGLAVVLISSWLTPRFGVLGMLLAQGLVQASFNNWWPIRRAMQGLGESRFRYWSYFSRPSQT